MSEASIVSRRYTYLHDHKWPSGVVDVHHIMYKSMGTILWSFLFGAILVKQMLWKCVVKESVVVFPGFGVQLETYYMSGRVVRHFIPISKILKPLLVECVTPVTCYWSLSLILRGDTELTRVFRETRPPVKMLVPVWKALGDAAGSK